MSQPLGEQEFLLFDLNELDAQAIFAMAATLKVGAEKYGSQTWRLVPLAEHANHAMAHLLKRSSGDESEDHLVHAFARCMMAVALQEEQKKAKEA